MGSDGKGNGLHTFAMQRLADVLPPAAAVLFECFPDTLRIEMRGGASMTLEEPLTTSAKEINRRTFAGLMPHASRARGAALGSRTACPSQLWARRRWVGRPRDGSIAGTRNGANQCTEPPPPPYLRLDEAYSVQPSAHGAGRCRLLAWIGRWTANHDCFHRHIMGNDAHTAVTHAQARSKLPGPTSTAPPAVNGPTLVHRTQPTPSCRCVQLSSASRRRRADVTAEY